MVLGMILVCDKLEIVHRGAWVDGFSTFVRVDGQILPELNRPMWDKEVVVKYHVDTGLAVEVLAQVRPSYEDIRVSIQFKQFDFVMGDVRVWLDEDNRPHFSINGYEPKVRSFLVRFVEGEACWTYFVILPNEPEPVYVASR